MLNTVVFRNRHISCNRLYMKKALMTSTNITRNEGGFSAFLAVSTKLGKIGLHMQNRQRWTPRLQNPLMCQAKENHSLPTVQGISMPAYSRLSRTLPNSHPRWKTPTKNRLRKVDKRTGTKSKTRFRLRRHTLPMENIDLNYKETICCYTCSFCKMLLAPGRGFEPLRPLRVTSSLAR